MENEPIQGSSKLTQEELDQKLIELDDFYGGYDPAFPEEFPIPRPSNLLEKDKSKQLTTKMSSRPLTMRENLNESVKEKLIDDFNTSESFAEFLANTAIGTTKKMGVADFTPAGVAFGIQESIKGYKEASYADDTAGQILSAIGLPLSVVSGLPLTAMGTKGAINLAKKLKVARAKVHGVDFGGTVGNASMVAMGTKGAKSMAMVKPKETEMISVFPKPERMFPKGEAPKGGDYLNPATGEVLTDRNVSSANIKINPDGKPSFKVSNDNVRNVGTIGKGNSQIKTNLFKKKAGWKWTDTPTGMDKIETLVSVTHKGKHFYTIETDFTKGVNLKKYPNSPTEPKLRPTVIGQIELGEPIGSISVRGKPHKVYNIIKAFNRGGLVKQKGLMAR